MSTNAWIVLSCAVALGVVNALGVIVILMDLSEIKRMLRRMGG